MSTRKIIGSLVTDKRGMDKGWYLRAFSVGGQDMEAMVGVVCFKYSVIAEM